MKKIQLKIRALEWSQHNTLNLQLSVAANLVVGDGIWPNFKIILAFMVVLLTCKNEEDPIKNEGGRVVTILYIHFSDAQEQLQLQS